MIIDMLEAVSEMLDDKTNSAESFMVQVTCAKLMLDKIIDGMKRQHITIVEEPMKITPPTPKPKIPRSDNYAIVLNDDRTIREITGLPMEAMVELDGVKMTHAQAIGKTFEQGRVI